MDNIYSRPTVFVKGSFDNLKTIDIRFFQEAAKLGNVHVLLFSDEASLIKNNKKNKFPLHERRYYLESIRFISQLTVINNTNRNIISQSESLELINYPQAVWAVHEKDANPEKREFCRNHGFHIRIIPCSSLARFPVEEANEETLGPEKKKVMVSGCFDWVHTGHVCFFEEVSAFGDLYVVVGHDKNLRLLKGEDHPFFPEEERVYWVQSIRFVKKAIVSSGDGWLDAAPEVHQIKPDIFIVNKDGDKPEKRKFFSDLNIEYKILDRKPKPGLPTRVSTNLRGF